VPGWAGGASWPGGAFDPELQMLFVPSMTVPIGVTLREPDASRSGFRYVAGIDTQIPGPRGLPLLKPPYGRLTAYDLARGEIAWVTPLGDGPRHHPLLQHLDLPPLGLPARSHALATKSLLFVTTGPSLYSPQDGGEDSGGSGPADAAAGPTAPSEAETAWWRESPKLRALDKRTGTVLWEHELSASPDGTPTTFLLEDGRQVLVLAIGGRGKPYELVAVALGG
jgi:quinoprotein glucose dehydrogenase